MFMYEYQFNKNIYANQSTRKLERNLHVTFGLVHIWSKKWKILEA